MSEPSTCLECGRPLIGGRCPDCDAQGLFQFVHREIVVLVALGATTLAVFVMTRAAALSSERIRMRDAAEWYAIGTAHLQSGETASAIQAFRRATSAARDNRTYRTGLADALAAAHEHDAARQVLVALRDLALEDPGVNLRLARLAAENHRTEDAVRYYQGALYGLWPPDRLEQRSDVRCELIRYLLETGQLNRALSEVLALTGSLPDDARSQEEAGRLFLRAGDAHRALDYFTRALRVNSRSVTALAGAGEAAFRAGDYRRASRYLHGVPDAAAAGVGELRSVVDAVLTR